MALDFGSGPQKHKIMKYFIYTLTVILCATLTLSAQLNMTAKVVKMDQNKMTFDLYLHTTDQSESYVLGNFDLVIESEIAIERIAKAQSNETYCLLTAMHAAHPMMNTYISSQYDRYTSTMVKNGLAIINVQSATVSDDHSFESNAAFIDARKDVHCLGRFVMEFSNKIDLSTIEARIDKNGLSTKFFEIKKEDRFPHVKIQKLNWSVEDHSEQKPDQFEEFQPVVNQLEVNVYPNPSSDFIRINWGQHEIHTIQIYHLNGQLMRAFSATRDARLDVSNLADGMYHIKCVSDQSEMTVAFIKN